jgi:phosphate transport system substrate-binding protein
MAIQYKCPNIGNCDKADQGELINIITGAPTNCPECNANLMQTKAPKTTNNNVAILGGMLAIILLIGAAGAWFFFKDKKDSVPVPNAPTSVVTPVVNPTPLPTPVAAQTLLRFHGSNTIGGKLLPAIAIAFLQQEGCSNVQKKDGSNDEESLVVGDCKGNMTQIEIQAHGSSTAFTALKDSLADIGMSSRKIKPEEQQALQATLGDLTSNASEHVIALDGIAVIVHASNPVKILSIKQIADIFSGTITDWSQVGGKAGAITVYARDDKSGTYDFFKETVLKAHKKNLVSSAQRFEDSTKLSAAVTADPAAIGFIGLNYIGANKALALSDTGVDARKPSLLTIKTEDYLLSRRLYLYTATNTTNPAIAKFIEFAVGTSAQPVISATGLVNMDLTPIVKTAEEQSDDPRAKSGAWRKITANATAEIPTRFHFRTGSTELDSRANRDIGRISGIAQEKYQGKSLILLGFADASGARAKNCELSQNRAEIVKKELAVEGLTFDQVIGLCDDAAIAPNDSSDNKEKNRRVEVWVK